MQRLLVNTFVCLMLLSVSPLAAQAEDSFLGGLWPFGKSKSSSQSFDNIDPFKSPSMPRTTDKTLGLPSPTKMIDGAEKRTEAMFQKTRETWKGVQDFGKSLNPFAKQRKQKPKTSMLDKLFPKQPIENASAGSPATMNDFMKLKRPRF